jgi:hypothetical protein
MLKKLLAILLALCMSISLFVGCGQEGSDDNDGKSDKKASSQKQDEDDDTDIDVEDLEKMLEELDEIDTDIDPDDVDLDDDDYDYDDDDDEDTDVDDDESDSDLTELFTFDLPDGWELTEYDPGYTVTYESETSMITIMDTFVPIDVEDAWGLAELDKESIEEGYADDLSEVVDPFEYNFGGYDAVRMEFLFPISEDLTQRQVYIYFFKGETAYTVVGYYFDEDEEGMEQVEGMFETVQVN